ncbi:L-fuculose kinase [Barnesiella viscericola DSM 18177]|uniref:L-fuculose kinase n=1 Tax=Barnesiella viscericola DSM 18177 TaxID=880074 RepID=W0EUL4_9BACT|nr:rhamnulokinase family protein [Barnesiella viscericola]AHF13218.1 L-fuculose kinase [Barnesiella viscericola DSM 18177]
MKEAYLAVDFGGGSGRVIAGYPAEGGLQLETVYRFPNRQVRMGGHIYWDFLSLFEDMKRGIRMAVDKGYRIKSVGIDTWGVDFGLIDKQGNLLGNPVCYRDSRTDGMPEQVFARIDPSAHYAVAGTQVMAINTLFQLYAMKQEGSPLLDVADRLLFMPDLFSYFLTGVANNEYSIASTSELMDIRACRWNETLMRELGLPEHLFGDIVMPGTSRGVLKPDVKEELGLDYDVEVIAVASHDTASAVYAVPTAADGEVTAFLSSGTWSLLGVVCDEPVLTEEARLHGFTNEGGAEGKICFLQNITGLWILQRLMSEWGDAGLCTDYEVLIPAAEEAEFATCIDVDDTRFASPVNMADAIVGYCREQGTPEPHTQGEFVKCVLLSLAERYRRGVEGLNRLLPCPITRLQIIGGGSQNRYLNRLTSQSTGLPVTAGPVEATAIGNIRAQMELVARR